MKKISLALATLALTGCGAEHGPYHLILVEKERHFYELRSSEACEPSGYDVLPVTREEQEKANVVELWVTFKNCEMKEKIILDDTTKPMWGVPIKQETKQKGKVGMQ